MIAVGVELGLWIKVIVASSTVLVAFEVFGVDVELYFC